MATAPTVFVVDDDSSVRKSIARLLASEGYSVTAFESANAFMLQHDPQTMGCILLDLQMPGLNGIELQKTLAERGSMLPVVFLTGHGDIHTSVQAMKSGAVDFLTKPADKAELLIAVAQALERSIELRRRHEQRAEVERLLVQLTPREREVLGCLTSGQRNKQIAADLGTVEKTIKVHRARVLHKMQVRTVADLVRMVAQAGIEIVAVGGTQGEHDGGEAPAARGSARPSASA